MARDVCQKRPPHKAILKLGVRISHSSLADFLVRFEISPGCARPGWADRVRMEKGRLHRSRPYLPTKTAALKPTFFQRPAGSYSYTSPILGAMTISCLPVGRHVTPQTTRRCRGRDPLTLNGEENGGSTSLACLRTKIIGTLAAPRLRPTPGRRVDRPIVSDQRAGGRAAKMIAASAIGSGPAQIGDVLAS